jgi:aminoglycoside phosphotransferase family enzyme
MKKPMNFGFLDFTSWKIGHFCNEELRLNQRLTKDLYLEVLPITGTPKHRNWAATARSSNTR